MFSFLLTLLVFTESPLDVQPSPIREDAAELQEDWVTRVLEYVNSNSETLEELTTSSHLVFEGDIIPLIDRNAVEHIWPKLEIPYDISPKIVGRTDDILSAMAMVSEHTCVSFHKRTSEMDYLLFKASSGCASYVGFIGGQQPVLVGPLCIVGNIAHEILHALGFHHEHTRMDRDKYITILYHNIIRGMEANFQKRNGQTFNLDYDISSIMHYGSGYFSANGLPTVVANSHAPNMGQRVTMTETDIKRVRKLYDCDAAEMKLEEDRKAREEGGKATEEGGKATEEGGKATEEGGKATEEGSKATEEGGKAKDCSNDDVNEGKILKTEANTNLHKLVHYLASTLDDTLGVNHTSTSASATALLRFLNIATRGQNITKTEES